MTFRTVFFAVAMTAATAATAVPTIYTNEAAFNAAVTGATVHGFNFADGTSLGTNYALGPVSFATTEAFYGFADAYGVSYLGGYGTELTFTSTTTAFGLHLGSYNGDQTVTYTVGGVTGTFVAPAPDSTTFIGFIDTAPISATLTNAHELDTISFTTGTVTPTVPEPESWALLVAGFGLAGIVSRRRSTPVVAA